MSFGITLTYWTVRASVACYVASILALPSARRAARALRTLGVALLFVHVACALHFVYSWDHARMVSETARQTAELTGVRFASAAYVNYAFMLVWAGDAAYWWLAGDPAYRRRPRAVTIIIHAFLAFIAFNAVVVFAKSAWLRYAGIAAIVLILVRTVTARHPSLK